MIADVRFPRGADDGPCSCACGWEGSASGFAGHKTDAGEKTRYRIRGNTGTRRRGRRISILP